MCINTYHAFPIATESISQLRKKLEVGKWVPMRSHEEKNELKAENQRKAEEIKSLKSQLAQALEKNQKLKGVIFGKARTRYNLCCP